MKNIGIWVIVAVVVVGGIYLYMSQSGGSSQPIVVALSAQNDSGMSGTATLTAMDGSTLVELDLTDAPSGIVQPAHIHSGSCANIGGVVYPLTFPVDGVSETTLDVSLDALLAQLPLALNVHKSSEEADIYVACGDLTQ
ncbi:CHRD domain-containing protein [Candidatus Kaiserbacteria bacterium]|nr:CHRD domain-containing protein [Candidatus Kaiserbacteria bacterium]